MNCKSNRTARRTWRRVLSQTATASFARFRSIRNLHRSTPFRGIEPFVHIDHTEWVQLDLPLMEVAS